MATECFRASQAAPSGVQPFFLIHKRARRSESGGATANVLFVFGAALCLSWVLWHFYRWHFAAFFEPRIPTSESPGLFLKPEPLTLSPPPREPARTVSYYGYSFEIPWGRVEKESSDDSFTYLTFANGVRVTVQNPKSKMGYDAAFAGVGFELGGSPIFTEEDLISAFEFLLRAVRRTPGELSLGMSRRGALRLWLQLKAKKSIVGEVKSRLRIFETEAVKGFQAGEPGRDRIILLHTCPEQYQVLFFRISCDDASLVTQDDLNRIIYSLRRAPDTPPARPPAPR